MTKVYFLGGLGSNQYHSQDLLNALSFPVIFLDLPGHVATRDSIIENKEDLITWFSNSVNLENPIILIGHSFGASLAAFLASSIKNVQQVILLDGAYIDIHQLGSLEDELRETSHFLEKTTYPTIESAIQKEKESSSFWSENLEQAVKESLVFKNGRYSLNLNTEAIRSLVILHRQIVPTLQSLSCPCLLIPQTKDIPNWKKQMLERVPDSVQIELIPDCGHSPHTEKPELVAQVISTFLSSNPDLVQLAPHLLD